jgi:redox-sensitive bicupin YhaK (pirin superfamily)
MSTLEQWISPHKAELPGGFTVGRVLPFRGGKGVGPFVFLDHMGPHTFQAGSGIDVGAHPHIGLSTVTYLFEGELEHRDSLGTLQIIRPGDVNWMTAGSGIAHTERTPAELRSKPQPSHGVQAWVALPVEAEETEPSFEHHAGEMLPYFEKRGVSVRLIAGEAFGLRAPTKTFSRLFYAHARIEAGSSLEFDSDGQEAAFFLVSGSLRHEDLEYTGPGLLHFKRGARIEITGASLCEGMLLGGEPLLEHRRIWWNFVSSKPERIEEAKRRWASGEFPKVPGETSTIPLPGQK